jgi:site-specific recombinase XerD
MTVGEVLRPRPAPWRQRLETPGLGTIDSFVGPYTTHLRSRRMSPATVSRYVLAARQLSAVVDAAAMSTDVALITRADIEKFIVASLEGGASPTTVNGRYVALVQFFKFVALEVKPEPFTSPMADMTPPAFEAPMIEVAPLEVIRAMLAECEGGRDRKTFEQIRDAALVRLFANTGARNAEITGLVLDDLLDGDKVRLWGKSRGKGPVERHVPYDDRTAGALRRYLRARAEHPAAGCDALWLGLRGPMTTSGVRQMIWKRSEKAGQRIHPHQFRHAFAHAWKKDARRKDGDLKYLAGWRTDTMLHRYGASAGAERAQEAYRELGSPMEDL